MNGRKVIVTGSSRGIGKAIAEALSAASPPPAEVILISLSPVIFRLSLGSLIARQFSR